jgi:hypothetical protein
MATIIQLKRSSSTTAPSQLAQGELAYVYGAGTQANNGDRLFIGTGTETAGAAANIDIIGGKYFTSLTDHVTGTLTASSAILVDSNLAIDTLNIGNSSTVGGTLFFNEALNNGANYVALKAPNTVAANITFTLPIADGTSDQVLYTNGSGQLAFKTIYSNICIVGDTGNDSFSTNECICFVGGTGLTSSVTNNTITYDIDSTVATLTGTQTLTNKTLTSPDVTTSLTTGSTSFNLINATATTVNFAGAATALSIGAATGTTTINNADLIINNRLKFYIFLFTVDIDVNMTYFSLLIYTV